MALKIQKSQPTAGDVHVNRPLTNISVAFFQDGGFVADVAFPQVPVENQSDLYYVFDRDDLWRDEAKPRAPGSESAGGGFKVTTASYSARVEAFHKDVDDQTRANADSQIQLDESATRLVSQKLAIRRERRWANAFFTTGVWGTDITGVAAGPGAGQVLQWDVANATPLKDVEAGKVKIAQETGLLPNTMIMGYQVFSKLRDNASIRDQFKYTSADSIDAAMMARYFGIDRILVMSAVYTSTTEGAAAATAAFIGGKQVLLCYANPAPSIMAPSAGYSFVWRGFTGSVNGVRIKRFRMENIASDRIEGEMAYDQKVVTAACGYFFNSIVS